MKNIKNQQGAASLLTVIFVAIILTIITLGFVRIAINEQRSATDDDLTTRAYFAAESGVEDAKKAIKEYTRGVLSPADFNDDECAEPTGYNATLSSPTDYDVEYTCQLIDLTPDTYKTHMDGPNQTIQFPINAVDASGNSQGWDRVVLRWHINDATVDGGDGTVGPTQRRANTGQLPNVSSWNGSNFPAMMDVSFFSHPDVGFTRSDIFDYRVLVNPGNSNAGDDVFNGSGLHPNNNDGEILHAECDNAVAAGDYYCEMEFSFTSTSNRQNFVRITNLYGPAHIEVAIYQGNTQRLLANAQATVDVTARAGDVFRRVETTLDLTQFNILPDFAITTAEELCKNFSITQNPAHFNGVPSGQPTSCTF